MENQHPLSPLFAELLEMYNSVTPEDREIIVTSLENEIEEIIDRIPIRRL